MTFGKKLVVVEGWRVSGSATIARDVYAEHSSKGKPETKKEVSIKRSGEVAFCLIGMDVSILFQKQNVAFIAVMPLVIAASVNFPILILAMFWRGFTTRGAVVGGIVGFVSSVSLIVLGPKVWVSIIGAESAIFPYDYPALFTMVAAFITMFIVSKLDDSAAAEEDRTKFDSQLIVSELATYVSASKDH